MNYDDDYEFEEEEEMHIDAKIPQAEIALEELMKHFSGIPENVIKNLAEHAAKTIAGSLTIIAQQAMKELVQRECASLVKELAGEFMQQAFTEVLTEKVVISGNSWDEKKITIREVVRQEMTNALQGIKLDATRDNYVKNAINSMMDKELTAIAKDAVDQFKKTTMKEISKGAMGEIVKSVAGTIAGDKKFLAVLEAMR